MYISMSSSLAQYNVLYSTRFTVHPVRCNVP